MPPEAAPINPGTIVAAAPGLMDGRIGFAILCLVVALVVVMLCLIPSEGEKK
ncbi:MAG TPA: hypothetical protein VGR91_19150 [Stellaceae bacterium]|nr:hypothetical protein [Stellaceae bacterium]